MDFDHALQIFNTLYADINGYTLSTVGRAALHAEDKAFTYGEVSPEAFYSILSHLPTPAKGVFYDLGSGTGKAVLLVHLLFDFSAAVGIELLKPLHDEALYVKKRYESEFKALEQPGKTMKFINADFLEHSFADADVVFMHSTCFPDHLWEKLTPKLEDLKQGAHVISVTRPPDSPLLKKLKSKEYGMAWGRATVYYHRKI
jgi:SAM-dependent methyltransferase